MKIILTGATGFIGSEVLRQCLRSLSTTSVIALSRRQLPEDVIGNPKLKVVIMNDFKSYPDTLLQDLAGTEACIRSLGIPQGTRESEVEYPMAAINAFVASLAPQLKHGERFRFVYVSGALAERDQEKKLWIARGPRRFKGETENILIDLGKQRSESLETYIVRPGFVLSASNIMPDMLGFGRSIRVDELAAVMVATASQGGKKQTMENAELRNQGKVLLRESKP